MSIASEYKQAVSDYKYLLKNVGEDAHDFCGGFCNTEMYQQLLLDNSQALALSHLKDLIGYWISKGVSDGSHIGNGTVAISVKSARFNKIVSRYSY